MSARDGHSSLGVGSPYVPFFSDCPPPPRPNLLKAVGLWGTVCVQTGRRARRTEPFLGAVAGAPGGGGPEITRGCSAPQPARLLSPPTDKTSGQPTLRCTRQYCTYPDDKPLPQLAARLGGAVGGWEQYLRAPTPSLG